MIDVFYAAKGQLRRPEFDRHYTPDQAIISATLTEVDESSVLTVVFPFWHAPQSFNRSLERRIQNRGTNVLLYNFNPLILNEDVESVKQSFEFITASIAQDISALRKSRQFTSLNLLGFSLGVVSLCLVAEELEAFDEVTLVVPGNDLASSLWAGLRTRRLRGKLRRAGHELPALQKAWENLAPQSHAAALRNHKLHIVLAKHDRFIPYEFGHRLLQALDTGSGEVTCETTPYGHVATIWRYLRAA